MPHATCNRHRRVWISQRPVCTFQNACWGLLLGQVLRRSLQLSWRIWNHHRTCPRAKTINTGLICSVLLQLISQESGTTVLLISPVPWRLLMTRTLRTYRGSTIPWARSLKMSTSTLCKARLWQSTQGTTHPWSNSANNPTQRTSKPQWPSP